MGDNGEEWNAVYRSYLFKGNLNPEWREDKIELFDLCIGDMSAPLLISVKNYDKSGQVCLNK